MLPETFMILEETDPRFYIADSTLPNAGKGIFAAVPIAKGESLEVLGVLVPAKSLADKCTVYADAYKFRAGKFLLIPTGLGGMANHSLKPNAKKIVKGLKVFLIALKDIKKGDEVLYIYGLYAQKKFLSS